jgi:asparagine synthase (glutamine-hydrolysing)
MIHRPIVRLLVDRQSRLSKVTSFIGLVSLTGRTIDTGTEQRIKLSFGGDQASTHAVHGNGALIVQQQVSALRGPVQTDTPIVGGERVVFAADARLDNRAELGAVLSISAPELARISDSDLILRLYRRFGDEGVARCLGAFAFALWDASERRLVLGRDCLGDRTLFFHHGDGFVAFATTLTALLALPEVPREIDEVALANYLALNLRNPRLSLYRGIERVPSRTLVTITPRGMSHRNYWAPNFDAPPPYKREGDCVARARELLDQAVATATADTPRVAISTSGGLDSSAIAATVARLGKAESISCFCIVPPEGMRLDVGANWYLDERDKISALARMHPTLGVEFCIEGGLHPFEADATRYFARTGLPIRNPTNLGPFSMLDERVAATGHSVKLVGNRGNFGLTWTGQYSLLALLRQGKLATFIRDFSVAARQNGRGIARTFLSDVIRPAAPPALRRQLYRLLGRDPDSVAQFSMLNPALIAEMDLSRQWQEENFDPWFGHNGLSPARQRAHFLFDQNQMARDNRSMSRSIHGFETRACGSQIAGIPADRTRTNVPP